MESIRRWVFAGIAVVVACEPGLAPSMRRGLERGHEAADQWIASAAMPGVSAPTAISVGYLERLRLGMGSPFRLADQALSDPRLDATNQRLLAWAILARTLDRQAYQIDPASLDGITRTISVCSRAGAPSPAPGCSRLSARARAGTERAAGLLHLELIDDVIRESDDPRAGELAVRLVYAQAASEGVLDAGSPQLAAQAAALLRDRELAREDVLGLLTAAGETRVDPLRLLGRWRIERRFAVEAPPIRSLSDGVEQEALASASRIGQDVRRITLGSGPDVPAEPRTASLIGPAAARRLATIADSAIQPPQAPVAIAVAATRTELLETSEAGRTSRAARERFFEKAVSEEAFAAEYALLEQSTAGAKTSLPAAARTALSVAIALRAYAQEPVWFPGFPGPSPDEIEARHGLTEVAFAEGVPASWQPYYLRVIDLALTDLRRVLPALDLTGLRVNISRKGIREGTLALHDPRRRRLILPPESGAGTIAHEIAHDLDWQVALGRYGVRGDYASDGAVRSPRDALAIRLTDLAHTAGNASDGNAAATHLRRPTEILARNVDWFVAAALAAQGRSNGYLTSIQDDVLTGYGSARPPDITGGAGEALIEVLDQVAPLDPLTREAFLTRYGRSRTLTAYDHARRMLESAGVRCVKEITGSPGRN